MQSSVGDIDGNLKKMIAFIEQAAEEKADIVCFPEMSLTGYSSKYGPENILSHDDPRIITIKDLASTKHINIIFGFMEKNDTDMPYLTQLTVCPDGTSMKYRKTHLGTREDGHFTEGNSIDVLKTEKAVIGVALCWEAHIPDIFTVLRRKGAELIFIPHASNLGGMRRKETWLRYLPARAWDNDMYVVACNAIGDNMQGSRFGGGSVVLNRKGITVFENFNEIESMNIMELEGFDHDDGMSGNMCDIKFFQRRRPELY